MPLPILETPIYGIKLPSTQEDIKFRSFLVKEKKILMIAKEENTPQAFYTAIRQIANNCTFGKVDVENLPLFDLQYLFLKIRAKSIGETSEFALPCDGCEHKIPLVVDLNSIEPTINPAHDKKIMITPTMGMVMKYPTMTFDKISSGIGKMAEKEMRIIAACIDYIFDGESVYPGKDATEAELIEFIERLDEAAFQKVVAFFTTMPVLHHTLKYVCPKCQKSGEMKIEDITDFFRLSCIDESLMEYYKLNFNLMQRFEYNLTELENMIPWEREIYISLLTNYIEEENKKYNQST